MNKLDFLFKLRDKLKGLPQKEVDERLNFYSEMIEDMVEEGLTEEEAVNKIGSCEKVAEQILADIPLTKIAKERIKPKRKIKTWEVILIILGSPIWLSLFVALFCVCVAIYACLWATIISLWAVFSTFVACGVALLFAGIIFCFIKKGIIGLIMIGMALICLGFGILMFIASFYATKGIARLTKYSILGIKKCFIKREEE